MAETEVTLADADIGRFGPFPGESIHVFIRSSRLLPASPHPAESLRRETADGLMSGKAGPDSLEGAIRSVSC